MMSEAEAVGGTVEVRARCTCGSIDLEVSRSSLVGAGPERILHRRCRACGRVWKARVVYVDQAVVVVRGRGGE